MQMDFLDPSRKRAHKRRLMIGYALMSVVVVLGSVLMLHLAYGFDIDRNTSSLIRNGLVYVDSKPNGAKVFLDNVEQRGRTDTKLEIPAGVYNIRVEADGFRHWERTIDLEGGEIERLVYPYLIPNEFITNDMSTYDSLPNIVTQSPDRRWLLVMEDGVLDEFDVYDLNDPEKAPVKASIPSSVLASTKEVSTMKFVEWSTNNRHVLFEQTYGDKAEFIMFDREKPNESININQQMGINPAVVSLKNKRPDQFYYLEKEPGVLRIADTKNRTISAPLIEEVIDYKSYGDDIVLYATQKDAEEGRTDFKVLEGNETYKLKTVSKSDVYVMDVSKYDNEWYYVVGGSKDNMAFVYENPLSVIKKEDHGSLKVVSIMRLNNPQFVSFSAGTQFIGLQSGNSLLTLDLEKVHQYRHKLEVEVPLTQQIKWMDGHRYIFTVDNQSYIVDFDGSNEETLVTSEVSNGPFFDRDYDNVMTFENSKSSSGKKALTLTVIDDR